MIKYVEHESINKVLWDSCIDKSPNGLVYGKSWFLDTVSHGWAALIQDDYHAVFPLTWRKKWGLCYLFQPFFTQQLGVFSIEPIDQKCMEEFLHAIPESYKLVEIQLNWKNTFSFTLKGITSNKRMTHHLSLTGDIEKLRSAYSENNRRNLAKAEKSSLVISRNVAAKELVELFTRNRGKHISNLKDKDYRNFLTLTDQAATRGVLEIIGVASSDGQIHAGAVFLRSNHEYIFLFSATDELARENGAMSHIIHTFIAAHAGENMILDFEGSMDAQLARFYKGFGSKEIVYLQIRKNALPLPVRWLKK